MLQVTMLAARALRDRLESLVADGNMCFRIVPSLSNPEELCMAPDTERDGDRVIESRDRKILLLDAEVARLLDERTIDFVETPQGGGFVIAKSDPRK